MIKNNRGVALATLLVTVIIMLIVTGTITYTSLDTMKLRKLDDMYNDIRLLNQKIAEYYIENDELPILENKVEYDEIKNMVTKKQNEEKVKINPNDNEESYYIIDLEKIGGITLRYGKDYKEYKNNSATITNNKDVYIINKDSHTIYYLKGIKINVEGISIDRHTLDEYYGEYYTEINVKSITE